MKNFILSLFTAICAIFASATVSAQSIPASMLPDIVAEMQKMCPQEIEQGFVMTGIKLQNSNKEMVFEFKINEKELGVNSTQIVNEFQQMTPAQKKAYLGEEFAQVAAMLPVPVYASFLFADGKTFKMKLTD